MLIGIPKEIKNNENRVALTPAGVHSLVSRGHRVLIETNAGLGSGFTDADYQKQGAEIVATAGEAWAAELVVKVKEPLSSEYGYLRDDLLLFTYLHMAAAPELADAMLAAKQQELPMKLFVTIKDNYRSSFLWVRLQVVWLFKSELTSLLSKLVALVFYLVVYQVFQKEK